MRPALWCLLLALAAAAPAYGQSPAPYRLDWLGQDFYPFAINDRGQVVGFDPLNRGHGPSRLWQNGSFTDLGLGEAHDINNHGVVVLGVPVAGQGQPGAVVRAPDGTRTDLGLPQGWGGDFRHQFSINDLGHVVGMQKDPVGADGLGFYWDGSRVTYLNLGMAQRPRYSSAHAVNNAGQAAGWYGDGSNSGGFVWQDGSVTLLPAPGVSINDRGDVLLQSAAVWTAGEATPLASLPLLPTSSDEVSIDVNPREINNIGQSVGWQWEAYFINQEDGHGAFERGILWDAAGNATDLNALMGLTHDERYQYLLAQPLDINNLGQIVGYGQNGGWILTPIPEPGAAALLLVCAPVVMTRRGKRSAAPDRLK